MLHDNAHANAEVVTPAPSDKDDCKQGGFDAYGFDNQGQCVVSLQAAKAADR